ncbi:ABC transporter ATP-binding protein [Bacillus toyonensis]
MMIWPMFAIGELINVMQRGNASLDRVNETLAYEPDVKNPKNPKLVQDPDYIQFDEVSFSYPSSAEENLKKVSFTLKQGETLGVVGKTGSGKTTLVRQLLRQYPLGEGDIAVSDVTLDKMTSDNVLGWIGYVPQEHILFSKTARENILFGNREATEEELEKAIEIAAFTKRLRVFTRRIRNARWRERCFVIRRAKAKDFDCESGYSKSRNINFGRFVISRRCSYGSGDH